MAADVVGTDAGDGAVDDVDRLRNIGIVAHINAGKTTLSERILYDTGKQRYIGDVEAGTATMDWMAEEQERGISITAAVTSVKWRGFQIDLVDTPGHVDFTAEVERCIRVLDGVIVLLDGVRGVESQTEAVWRTVDRQRVPRIAFVNKLDRPSADYWSSVDSLRRELGCRPIPLVVPLSDGGATWGMLDVISGAVAPWSEAASGPVDAARTAELRQLVVEACADFDEAIMADFVDGRPVDDVRLHAALRAGTLRCAIVPVFGGSALQNHGVRRLLDAVCRYLPSPRDRASDLPVGTDVAASDDPARGPLVALAFKNAETDAERPLTLIRVFRGTLRAGDELETGAGRPVSVRAVWRLHAVQRDPVDVAVAGRIVAIESSVPLRTGETLRARGTDVVLEPLRFSQPVLTMALEPQSAEHLAELELHATALAGEDPTLVVSRDGQSGTWLVSGMGELHLEVFGSRLNRAMSHSVRFGVPAVARCESVLRRATASAECQRTVGGRRFWASAAVELVPRPGRHAAEVHATVPADRADPALVDAVIEGLRRAVATGLDRPMPAAALDVRIADLAIGGAGDLAESMAETLAHEAAAVAVRRAMAAAGPIVLEPWMRFSVVTPPSALSGVLADLRSRGAAVASVVADTEQARIQGTVPLARVVGYATPLRSMTRGKAQVELAFDRFDRSSTTPPTAHGSPGAGEAPSQKEVPDLDRDQGDR